MPLSLSKTDQGIILPVHIVVKARKTEIAGLFGQSLKLKIASVPVLGKANREVIKFLSSLFGISKNQIKIVSGEKSKDKKILLTGIKAETICAVLNLENAC